MAPERLTIDLKFLDQILFSMNYLPRHSGNTSPNLQSAIGLCMQPS